VWSGTSIADTTLAGVIAELRTALDDDAHDPRFIRTAHRVGYAFSGEVDGESEQRKISYRVIVGDQQFQLHSGANVLGRDRTATLWIDHPSISRRHAEIVIRPTRITVQDLGSKNGTFVRGQRTEGEVEIGDRDEIRLGNVAMLFRVLPEGIETESIAP
jgi:hypothetical protein